MKTTVEIHDALLLRAKRQARENGHPLRSLIEAGRRRVMDDPAPQTGYRLPDRSLGDPNGPDPLAQYSWPEPRDLIYEDHWDWNP